ncbi:single-stranded DNA-binding protein [Arthrobacter sp.]|uniref:single-stranded DNA-binding protein n=1 Tax=Arthrobacter sp. TaxID=1667 RepID=UPI003A940C99
MRDANNFITVVGNVGTDPFTRTHANNFQVTQFRVGTDNRRKNPHTGEWENKSTNWYTIKVFNQLGLNAAASIRKGQRVFVGGYAKVDQFTREDGSTGVGIDVEAQFIGHDLKFGTSEFHRLPQVLARLDDEASAHGFTVDGEEYDGGDPEDPAGGGGGSFDTAAGQDSDRHPLAG